MRIIFSILFLCGAVDSLALAEIIKLKTGQVIDGVVVEKTDAVIKIRVDDAVTEIAVPDVKYIRGEGLDVGSSEHYQLLNDALNEPDTNLEGWRTVDKIKFTIEDSPAVAGFKKGREFLGQGLWDESIVALTQAIDGGVSLADAYYYRANAFYNKKDLDKAISDYTSSLDQKPDNALAYGNRGECYRKLGQLMNALDDLNKAHEFDPQNDLVLANRASTHYGLQHIDLAIADMSAAIELKPQDPVYYSNRDQFYAMLKKYDEALTDMDKAISLGWNDPHGMREQILQVKQSSTN